MSSHVRKAGAAAVWSGQGDQTSQTSQTVSLGSRKLSKIKALAGAAVLTPEPAHGMCLGQVPAHVPMSAQAGPHLTLVNHWPDTSRACPAAASVGTVPTTFKST